MSFEEKIMEGYRKSKEIPKNYIFPTEYPYTVSLFAHAAKMSDEMNTFMRNLRKYYPDRVKILNISVSSVPDSATQMVAYVTFKIH